MPQDEVKLFFTMWNRVSALVHSKGTKHLRAISRENETRHLNFAHDIPLAEPFLVGGAKPSLSSIASAFYDRFCVYKKNSIGAEK